jgi:hypothetical protein
MLFLQGLLAAGGGRGGRQGGFGEQSYAARQKLELEWAHQVEEDKEKSSVRSFLLCTLGVVEFRFPAGSSFCD